MQVHAPKKGQPCLALDNYGQVDPLLPILPTFQEKNLSSDFNMNFSNTENKLS